MFLQLTRSDIPRTHDAKQLIVIHYRSDAFSLFMWKMAFYGTKSTNQLTGSAINASFDSCKIVFCLSTSLHSKLCFHNNFHFGVTLFYFKLNNLVASGLFILPRMYDSLHQRFCCVASVRIACYFTVHNNL
ncbi:hypothetical protein EG68_02076 [Paragonimus skrjabini miyazakii]|uniref:Uncharacterized protein n=1 Tax=Paragonimus skrjabini miyazakii TaxID=59628 RepID=A0A8S9Z482_9TREM|nr:hypothetical protein EG68_02076 [Paragonimus skrjabini miyazakii]